MSGLQNFHDDVWKQAAQFSRVTGALIYVPPMSDSDLNKLVTKYDCAGFCTFVMLTQRQPLNRWLLIPRRTMGMFLTEHGRMIPILSREVTRYKAFYEKIKSSLILRVVCKLLRIEIPKPMEQDHELGKDILHQQE